MAFTRWLRAAPPSPLAPVRRLGVECLEGRTTPSTGGLLDPTFGTGGVVASSFTNHYDAAHAVTVQPDGKTVVVGETGASNSTTGSDFLVARYNPDGSPDTSFGTGGYAATDFKRLSDDGMAVALQPQATGPAKVLAGGYADTAIKGNPATVYVDFALARYNANGTLDTTFGTKGKVLTDLGGIGDYARSMVVQPDGKIILAGRTNAPGGFVLALVRYTPNGALDSSFGSGGKLITAIPTYGSSQQVGLQPQADGTAKIVAATLQLGPDGLARFVVARFNPNGTTDAAFGAGGQVAFAPVAGTNHDLGGLAVQGDGKIVLSGDTQGSTTGQPVVVRLTPDGSPDTGFGTGGTGVVVVPAPAGFPWASSDEGGVAVQADGQIVVGLEVEDAALQFISLAVLRVEGDGTVDAGYGAGGYAITRVEYTSPEAYGIAVGPDGRAVVAGYAKRSAAAYPSDIALVRFLASAPQVGAAAAAAPAADGTTTLTAAGITDGNPGATVTRVEFFYFDASGTKQSLGFGAPAADGSWSLAVALPPGAGTVYAQATDSYGAVGDPLGLTTQVG